MPRKVKAKPYKSFRLSKRVNSTAKPLPSALAIFRSSWRHLYRHWRVFLGIIAVYLLLTLVFVKGFGVSHGVEDVKVALEGVFKGAGGQLATGFTLFGLLVQSAGSATSEVAGTYQSILLLIVSLVLIWALRQTHAKEPATTKQAFYKGLYPLVPFLLVLAVVALQLVPLMLGSWIQATAIGGGLAISAAEQAGVWLVLALLALLSFYMLTSSVFALYIVTLPDMTPLKALRSGRELVRHRRWTVMRKVLALPLFVFTVGALIMIPLILFVTPAAEATFLFLNMAVLAVVHSYLYSLYRELL